MRIALAALLLVGCGDSNLGVPPEEGAYRERVSSQSGSELIMEAAKEYRQASCEFEDRSDWNERRRKLIDRAFELDARFANVEGYSFKSALEDMIGGERMDILYDPSPPAPLARLEVIIGELERRYDGKKS